MAKLKFVGTDVTNENFTKKLGNIKT